MISVLSDCTIRSLSSGKIANYPGGVYWIGRADNVTDAPPVSNVSHGLLTIRIRFTTGYITICIDADAKGAWKRVLDSVSWVEL